MTIDTPLRASARIALIGRPDAAARLGLPAIYGGDAALCEERRARMRSAIMRYREVYGDDPVRVFRAPGRINLRGMHVDTHGGWLNLMTHQREVLVVSGASPDGAVSVANTNPAYGPLRVSLAELPQPEPGAPWGDFIGSGLVCARHAAAPGHWRNYIEGAWRRARFAFPGAGGLRLVVDSTLPEGAALSSSAALCIALLQSWAGWYGAPLQPADLILAAQDAEWYTGSRCGTCDQAAIVLGQPNAIIHAALDPRRFSIADARAIPFPDALRILVINSHTVRNISGADKIAYTTNRFAYSMALSIFQQAAGASGLGEGAGGWNTLAAIGAESLGGNANLYGVLRDVPERIALGDLRAAYDLPHLDAEYARYFGDLPDALKPREIGLRGPLLFGIAESARARSFALAMEAGAWARAGALMSIGHDGDRRVDRDGRPVLHELTDARLDQLAASDVPIEECPGAYGASSPALDALVDAALEHGALGASLTGAGIAGVVLALCRAEDAARIAEGVRQFMGGAAYTRAASLPDRLSPAQLAGAVVENRACAGAGEVKGEW
ncbi:MAG: hypothetical protein KF886_17100 [Candidatus Hydrogenedentes bacterium]|nr:hypothetical protein [Candidatus Hydrogenedentota bacterium]